MVSGAMSGVTRAKAEIEKEQISREKKEQARAEKAATAAKKESDRKKTQTGGKAGKPGSTPLRWAIRALNLENHPGAVEVGSIDAADFFRPWVLRQADIVQEMLGMAPAKLNFLVFKTGFGRETTPGEQRVLKAAEGIRSKFVSLAPHKRVLEEGDVATAVIKEKVCECMLWALRGGVEKVTAVSNGLGALYAVASEWANYQVLLVQGRAKNHRLQLDSPAFFALNRVLQMWRGSGKDSENLSLPTTAILVSETLPENRA